METSTGKLVRALIVLLLLYSAYTVAFCPCVDTELLACHNHGATYFGALIVSMALIPAHHGLSA
jgi:hypothetical protein